jgi:hypothetical protein
MSTGVGSRHGTVNGTGNDNGSARVDEMRPARTSAGEPVSRYAIGVHFGTQSGRAVFVVPLHDYVGRGESNVMKTSRGPRAAAWAEGS